MTSASALAKARRLVKHHGIFSTEFSAFLTTIESASDAEVAVWEGYLEAFYHETLDELGEPNADGSAAQDVLWLLTEYRLQRATN